MIDGAIPSRIDQASVCDAVLCELQEVRALYVFGSHARGDARGDSDLDLAVLTEQPIDPVRLFEAQRTLSVRLDNDVDLVDLARASSVLRSEVVNGGVLLYQCDAQQTLEFEARVLGEYAELLDATRDLREAIHQRGSVYAR